VDHNNICHNPKNKIIIFVITRKIKLATAIRNKKIKNFMNSPVTKLLLLFFLQTRVTKIVVTNLLDRTKNMAFKKIIYCKSKLFDKNKKSY